MTAITLYGGLGSPYSMKIRALLRYRRIAYRWVQVTAAHEPLFAEVRVPVIPIVRLPNGRFLNDSTSIAAELDRLYPDDRRTLPDDPLMAFCALLLEDFADEWLTKIMFHYRWHRDRDRRQLAQWLAYDRIESGDRAAIAATAEWFRTRQVERMPLVGCTPENAPALEESYAALLAAFEAHVGQGVYLLGSRPSIADFAWAGQFSQLASDPTSADRMRETAPLLMRWLGNIDDASGVEGVWRADALTPLATDLLRMAAETHLPFLAANAAAIERGDAAFELVVHGHRYRQAPFRYQLRCLEALRTAHAALPADAADRLRALGIDLAVTTPA